MKHCYSIILNCPKTFERISKHLASRWKERPSSIVVVITWSTYGDQIFHVLHDFPLKPFLLFIILKELTNLMYLYLFSHKQI